jgi:hypothetical protein
MKKILEQVKKWLVEAKAGKEIPDADLTAGLVLTSEAVAEFLETEEGKKLLQPRLDSFFTKGLNTWKEKSFPELLEAEIKKRFPGETAEQKQIRELQMKQTESDRKAARAELKNKAIEYLTAKKLPLDLIDNFIADDENATTANLTKFEKFWTEKLQAEVDVIFKKNGRGPEKGSGGVGGEQTLNEALTERYKNT